jgi:type IV pilus assembly protein PilE
MHMAKFPSGRPLAARGFSLIELMTVMMIGGVLLAIAVASYSSQVRKSRRTEAKTAMLDLAGREERNLSTTNAYSAVPAELGYTAAAYPMAVGSGYYTLSVAVVPPAPGAPAQFTITATPVGDQAKDTACASFTVDQQGNRLAVDSGGADATAVCWR